MHYALGDDEAAPASSELVSHYETLTGQIDSGQAGTHSWTPVFKKDTSVYNSVMAVYDAIVKYRWALPTNSLETFFLSLIHPSESVSYYLNKFRVNYRDTAGYIATIEQTYDLNAFVSLLNLHEAAGLCLDAIPKYGTTPSGMPLNCDLFKIPQVPEHPCVPMKFFNTNSGTYISPYRPVSIENASDREEMLELYGPESNTAGSREFFNDNFDKATLRKLRYITYPGFEEKQDSIVLFMQNVARFRERVLATMLQKSFFMLNTAKLSDEGTLRTMFQYFDHAAEDYQRLNRTESISVTGPDGKTFIREFKISDIKGLSIVMPDPFNPGKQTAPITVLKALQLQFEACVWLVSWNMNKLTGRIAQLQDPTATVKKSLPIDFSEDPWQNPFLLFDEKASKSRGKSTFIDVAQSTAARQTPKSVESAFVPLKNMLEAKNVYQQLHRVPTGGGGYKNPMEMQDESGAGGSVAPFVFAAAAAGLIFYLQNR